MSGREKLVSRQGGRSGRLLVRLTAVFTILAATPLLLNVGFFVAALRGGWLTINPEAADRLAGYALCIVVGGLLATITLLRFLRRSLMLPLRELRESASQLGRGDLGRRVTIHSDDELAEAAEGLNLLADRISLMTGDLEDRVAERTRDLGRVLGELHLLKKLNDEIIHNIPNGIAILSEDGRLLYVSAAFHRVWHISMDQLGQDLRQLGTGGPLAEIDWPAEVTRVLDQQEPVREETVYTGSWPNRRVVRYSLFPLPPAQLEGPLQLVGDDFCMALVSAPECERECEQCIARTDTWRGRQALLLIDDITDRQRVEAQLIQSEKLAALGQLSAGIAHEIRNPLSAISGAAFYIGDVLTDEEPDLADVDEYVRLIRRNVDRAQRIVTDILNFARPADAVLAEHDLGDLVAQTLSILDKSMVDQGIDLRREIQDGVVVQVRADTVKQALLNLIVNGMQAMPEGGVLSIQVGIEDGRAVISVADTGVGIAPENLKQIFNPFFTTKPAGQGTGLGLSIARQAIESDNGRVEVESQVGVGTKFRMWFPAVRVELADSVGV